MLRMTIDEVSILANELCKEFQALGKRAEAAKIALEYCNDVQSTITLLVTA
jgi:elongator complex protein 1